MYYVNTTDEMSAYVSNCSCGPYGKTTGETCSSLYNELLLAPLLSSYGDPGRNGFKAPVTLSTENLIQVDYYGMKKNAEKWQKVYDPSYS